MKAGRIPVDVIAKITYSVSTLIVLIIWVEPAGKVLVESPSAQQLCFSSSAKQIRRDNICWQLY